MPAQKRKERISTWEFWQRLREIIPPGGAITWKRLWREFDRKGTGLRAYRLIKKGYIWTNYRGEIGIVEAKRGEELAENDDA